MMILGGAAALVGVAIGLNYLMEKGESTGDNEEADDMVDEIGELERDQNGMIEWK